MTALQERVLRELVDCVDGRASGCALRLTIKLGAAAWSKELRDLEAAGWVVEDRWAPNVVVLTAAGVAELRRVPVP